MIAVQTLQYIFHSQFYNDVISEAFPNSMNCIYFAHA